MSDGIHLGAILQVIPQPSISEISLKTTTGNLQFYLPGVNELQPTHH